MSMIQIDMEMPTSCEECKIWSRCWAEDPHWWKRREDCPLHEVNTDPDTVSRQAVIGIVHKIILGFFSDEDGTMNDTEKTLLSVSKAVCNGVRELPPSPIRPHGHEKSCDGCEWEENYNYGECQLCTRNFPDRYTKNRDGGAV